MKKVVLSLALVAMMFVSCKEAEANTEEVVVEEPAVEAVVETVDTTAVVVEEVATEVATEVAK